jgi:sugar/nucleoside kinase (ribokinase family)
MNPRILLFDGHEWEASVQALQAFPEATSILDAGSWRDGTARLAGEVDYLVASERFARQATGLTDLQTASAGQKCLRLLREKFETNVVVTLGERGLIAEAGRGAEHLPAYPAQAVDTTAAGDIFHGAFAYGLMQKLSLAETLRLAAMTAALSVGRMGGRGSIPQVAEVKEALARGS